MRVHSPNADVSKFLCAEVLAEWLSWRLSHADLVTEVERLLGEQGPAFPRSLRKDFRWFLEDRSSKVLAECLAMNESPEARANFVSWCQEVAAESADPYRTFGVRRRDFCAEQGPGRTSRS